MNYRQVRNSGFDSKFTERGSRWREVTLGRVWWSSGIERAVFARDCVVLVATLPRHSPCGVAEGVNNIRRIIGERRRARVRGSRSVSGHGRQLHLCWQRFQTSTTDRVHPDLFACNHCSSPRSFVLATALCCKRGGDELLVRKSEASQKLVFLRLEDLGRSSEAG